MEYLVNQALIEWQVYNLDPGSDNYMNETQMQNAIQYIIKNIIINMTPVIRLKLSVGYPMEDETKMIESIRDRAKLVVLNYTVNQNKVIENEAKTIPNVNAF